MAMALAFDGVVCFPTKLSPREFLVGQPDGVYTVAMGNASAASGASVEARVNVEAWAAHVSRVEEGLTEICGQNCSVDITLLEARLRDAACLLLQSLAKRLVAQRSATPSAAPSRAVHGGLRGMVTLLCVPRPTSDDERGTAAYDVFGHVKELPIEPPPLTVGEAVVVEGGRSRCTVKDSAWCHERLVFEDRAREAFSRRPAHWPSLPDRPSEVILTMNEGMDRGGWAILEGCVTNVFAVVADEEGDGDTGNWCVHTAPAGVLPGVMRGLTIKALRDNGIRVLERAPRLCDAHRWRHVFLTSVAKPVVGIERLLIHPQVASSARVGRDFTPVPAVWEQVTAADGKSCQSSRTSSASTQRQSAAAPSLAKFRRWVQACCAASATALRRVGSVPVPQPRCSPELSRCGIASLSTLLIDNYDSYTFNLSQQIARVSGRAPVVIRNDDFGGSWQSALDQLRAGGFVPDCVVISPGPGHPSNAGDFGMCRRAIAESRVPLLGVCLGHQGIADVFGAKVVRAPAVAHGVLARIAHTGSNMFHGLPQGFEVVRYHSLCVDSDSLAAAGLQVTARVADPDAGGTVQDVDSFGQGRNGRTGSNENDVHLGNGVIMGLSHKTRPIHGVQFHPESIETQFGDALIGNFLSEVESRSKIDADAEQDSERRSGEKRKRDEQKSTEESDADPSSSGHSLCFAKLHVGDVLNDSLAGERWPELCQAVFDAMRGNVREGGADNGNDRESTSKPSEYFWLDTAVADPSMGRFSYYGGASLAGSAGQLSHRIEAWDGGRITATTTSLGYGSAKSGPAEEEELASCGSGVSVFDVLQERLSSVANNKAENIVLDVSPLVLGTFVNEMSVGNGEARCIARSASSLPMPFRCGYVGFFGYELYRNDPRFSSSRSAWQSDASGANGDTVKVESSGEGHNANENATPTARLPHASWLFADRIVCADAAEQTFYALWLSPQDAGVPPNDNGDDVVCDDDLGIAWARDTFELIVNAVRSMRATPSGAVGSRVIDQHSMARKDDENSTSYPQFPRHQAPALPNLRFRTTRPRAQYWEDVDKGCLGAITAGESYEICLTNHLVLKKARQDDARHDCAINGGGSSSGAGHNDGLDANISRAGAGANPAGGPTRQPHQLRRGCRGLLANEADCVFRVLRKRNAAPYSALFVVDHGCAQRSRRVGAVGRDGGGPARGVQESPNLSSPGREQSSQCREYAICCSSPERFLRVLEENPGRTQERNVDKRNSSVGTNNALVVESKPIKGTIRRDLENSDEDASLAEGLRTSLKDRSENLMIVDLVRNDLSTVCDIGSVHVPKLMGIETFATVHQLVSTIRGRLREGKSALDAVAAAFPGGSMTGAPKYRTMRLIEEMEQSHPRGPYSGCLGFLSVCGQADLNIVIRTAVMTKDEVSVGAGGAVIGASTAESEYDEMLLKARRVVSAVGEALSGDGACGGQVMVDYGDGHELVDC